MKMKMIMPMALLLSLSQAAVVMPAEKVTRIKPLPNASIVVPAAPVLTEAADPKERNVSSLETKIKLLQAESQKLKEELAKRDNILKSIQGALANADSNAKRIEGERQKLGIEVQELKSQLSSANAELQSLRIGGKSNLLTLADSGEAVFFKGIGEARMAALDGKSILRFPLSASSKADKVLLGVKTEKHMNGAFVYYILDSAGLVF